MPDTNPAIRHFQAILQEATVWPKSGPPSYAPFDEFLPLLQELYPAVFAQLELRTFNTYGILLHWPGRHPEEDPVIFMSHYDVVAANAEEWTYPPFAAEIHDGSIWARGSVDMKCILTALLESAEALLNEGFQPNRDIYFSFGNNEESAGDTVPYIVQYFKDQSLHPWLVLDEGGRIKTEYENAPPIANIGVSEKGTCNVTLTAFSTGEAHSSLTSPADSTYKLTKALDAIRDNPFPKRILPVFQTYLNKLDQYNVPYDLTTPELNAMSRTTTALTMLHGGDTINAIPTKASASYSVRILPGEHVPDVVQRIKDLVGPDIQVTTEGEEEPSPISPYDNAPQFNLLAQTAKEIYGADATPFVMIGGTDSRHFARAFGNTYRFSAFPITTEEHTGVHGIDEHLSVETFLHGIQYYTSLMRKL